MINHMRYELGDFEMMDTKLWDPSHGGMECRFKFKRWVETDGNPYIEFPVIQPSRIEPFTQTTPEAPKLETVKYAKTKVQPWPWSDEPREVYASIRSLKVLRDWMKNGLVQEDGGE